MNSLLKIIISMIIWGSIGLFVKNIDLPSMEIVFLRGVIASIFLILYGIIFKRTEKNKFEKKNVILLICSGIAISINWIFLFQAYKYTTIANATLSYYFAPVFIILLSPIVLKEQFTKAKLVAVIGAMFGLYLVLSNQIIDTTTSYNHKLGITFGILAAIFYASVVLMNKYIKGLSGYITTLIQISTATLILLPFIIYRGNLYISDSSTIFFILVVGIVHTALPYVMYFSSIKDIKAQTVALVSYIDPISAVVFSTLFLKENLTLLQILGGLLILGCTFLGNKKNS